jgi:hypothetical protein
MMEEPKHACRSGRKTLAFGKSFFSISETSGSDMVDLVGGDGS